MLEMVKTKQQLVASRSKTYPGTNGRKYITIHETANTGKGANAQAHANLQSNGFSASWHWSVDSKEAIQSFPHTVKCWHAGNGEGNHNSIGIEICVNSDGNFKQAVQNAAELVLKIMKEENITINNVVQHNHWSGKNCPTNLRNGSKGINWGDFLTLVKGSNIPVSTKDKPDQIQVLVDNLNYYDTARWDKPTGTVGKGTILTIDSIVSVGGAKQYKTISGTFITANEKYVKPYKAKQKQEAKTTRIRVKVAQLNYYDSPRWTKPSGVAKMNEIFTVIKKVDVQGSFQYQLKSGNYITANTKYVEELR